MSEYNKENPLRVFEAFAGYGSQSLALRRVRERSRAQYGYSNGLNPDVEGFDFKVVGISEIDPYALQAYKSIHGHCPNYGDISKIDWSQVPDFDLFTYSFPCTDISNAGLQKGLSEGSGTRSGLLWECRKAIETKMPKYLLMENVKALLIDAPHLKSEAIRFLSDITPIRKAIRKLTERECFRLMDVNESDIDKIQDSGVSRSQQYKMAGNSIVVACMEGIFYNLFSTEEQETLTLF